MKKYFKKFSIMFVILLAIMGIGVSQNSNVANAATIGQALTAPESGWRRYDNNDSRLRYSGNWASNSTGIYSGNTEYYTITQNAIVNFKFKGTKLRLIGSTNDNREKNIAIYIDNQLISTFSEYSSTWVTQILVFNTTNLTDTIHDVRIINPSTNHVALDAIDIDDAGYLVNPNESVTLDKSSIDLNVGNSQQLVATAIPVGSELVWSSSDTSVATVDSTGKVTAVKEGQATITATTTDGSNLSATCTVNVTNPIIPGVTLNKTSDSLITGQTDNLIATTTPSGTSVTWSSSDPSIATVDSTGKITAIKAGTVTITASTSNGLTAACTLTVTNPTDNSGGTSTGTDGTSTIVNTAHAKGDNTNNAGGDVSIIFNGLPDTTLSVVKTADVKSVYVGDNFTYTIVVTNTGAKTAKSVVINDSAPNHIQFMPSGITTTQGAVDPSSTSSNTLVNVGDIPPLGTVTIKIPATVIL